MPNCTRIYDCVYRTLPGVPPRPASVLHTSTVYYCSSGTVPAHQYVITKSARVATMDPLSQYLNSRPSDSPSFPVTNSDQPSAVGEAQINRYQDSVCSCASGWPGEEGAPANDHRHLPAGRSGDGVGLGSGGPV